MAGVTVTTLRAATTLFSSSYLDETFAFVVPDYAREQFSKLNRIRDLPSVTIAVPDVPTYVDKLRQMVPRAQLRLVQDIGLVFAEWNSQVDALAIPAERDPRGHSWSPKFSVVVPEPGIIKVPLAYPIGRHDAAFASFMTSSIQSQAQGRNHRRALCLLGARSDPARRPRWSVIRDVLHWIE